jgi:hypothetical protein
MDKRKKSLWLDFGTQNIVRDYQKRTRQSFSKTVCIIINLFVRHGLEGTYQMERAIEAWQGVVKERDEKIRQLEARLILKADIVD